MKCQESSSRTLLSAHKSKSYEERELEYNEARSRIFNTESVSFLHIYDGGDCGNSHRNQRKRRLLYTLHCKVADSRQKRRL